MAMRERRNLVLQQMFLQHYINGPELKDALNTPLPSPESVRQPATQSPAAPYFANYVTNQLVERYGARHVFGGGMKVVTTIDLGLQKIAREAIDKVLPPSIGPSAALVAIDVHTGQVVAMIGGRNFRASQFNLATQGERQPGSAFKPFVLATALRDGIAPSSILVSHPVVLDAGGRAWSVTNFEHNSMGPINLNTAIAYSDNTVFAQLTNIVGPGNVADTAAQMGITSPLHSYFSIGLGGEPATPVEMARAYATLANGGYRLDSSMFHNQPNAVQSITFPSKNPSKPNPPTSNTPIAQAIPWLTNGNAAIEDQMLQGVVQYGTGTAAQLPGWQVAGKTGTTENYGDAWFVGYTPDMVTAVWVGYPNKLIPMTTEYHGHTVEGGTFPARDLEGVHGEGPPLPPIRPHDVPCRERPVRVAGEGDLPRRQAPARQRQLPRSRDPRVLQRQGAGRDRAVQAERGRGARRPRSDARGGEDAADRPAAPLDGRLRAREAREAARDRRRPVARRRDALGLPEGQARRLAGGLRRRAEAGRAVGRPCTAGARAA